jgi:hypothetical protein
LIQLVFACVAFASIFIAAKKYLFDISAAKTSAAIDQVSFFRSEIIESHIAFFDDLKDKNQKMSRIRMDEFDLAQIIKKNENAAIGQMRITNNPAYFRKCVSFLNLLEEFALRVFHHDVQNHHAMRSLKAPFVEVVEYNVIGLLRIREIEVGAPTYDTVIKLYNEWKDDIDRRTPKERMTKIWIDLYQKSVK